LQGFGAGVSGQLPQFQQALAQRQERQQLLSRERVQAAALDARAVSNFLGQNRPDLAMEVLGDRKGAIDQFGDSNSFETDEAISALQSAIASGDPAQLAAVKAEFDDDVAVFTSQGLLPQEERVSALDQSRIDLNEARIAGLRDQGADVPADQRAFEALIADFTPEQQKKAKLIRAGLRGRVMSNALLSAIESGDVTNLADAKAEIKQAEKFAELTGSSRAKAIDKGFDSIVKIDAGIGNIDRALSALDKGAGVGAVEKLWPSIKSASVELDNIRGRMALDVVGATTFGALSQGELELAKNVALPTGLDTAELKDHLIRKKDAQNKLRAYYNEQIQFLDQGGTVAGFLREKERGQGTTGGQGVATQSATQTPAVTPSPTATQAVPVGGSAETGTGQTQRLVFDPATGQLVPK
jgi:hypothetical protein